MINELLVYDGALNRNVRWSLKSIHLSFLEEVFVFICLFVFACNILTHSSFFVQYLKSFVSTSTAK